MWLGQTGKCGFGLLRAITGRPNLICNRHRYQAKAMYLVRAAVFFSALIIGRGHWRWLKLVCDGFGRLGDRRRALLLFILSRSQLLMCGGKKIRQECGDEGTIC